MKTLNTGLTVVSEIDVRGRALLALILANISFTGSYYGFRPTGADATIRYPAIFVEPKSEIARMTGTAKFELKFLYGIYWYVRGNSPEDVVSLSSWIGEALIKLFSNNALGDLGIANPPSNKYRNYANTGGGYYWLDSEMIDVRFATAYLEGDAGAKYERMGRMMFQAMDLILK